MVNAKRFPFIHPVGNGSIHEGRKERDSRSEQTKRKGCEKMREQQKQEGFYKIPENFVDILEIIRSNAEEILDEIVPLLIALRDAKCKAEKIQH